MTQRHGRTKSHSVTRLEAPPGLPAPMPADFTLPDGGATERSEGERL